MEYEANESTDDLKVTSLIQRESKDVDASGDYSSRNSQENEGNTVSTGEGIAIGDLGMKDGSLKQNADLGSHIDEIKQSILQEEAGARR
jgi:hypothetical protein